MTSEQTSSDFTQLNSIPYTTTLRLTALAESNQIQLDHDLLSFLALAQCLGIDILPITWQPALRSVGLGGTAEIHQSRITVQTSLAFKRPHEIEKVMAGVKKVYQRLVTEILVLGHPSLHTHANIGPLLGVCWDMKVGTPWPVLVFKKARFGNLKKFARSSAGKSMELPERLKLCADVATAIIDMHACNIIHGDIKPENIVVCEVDTRGYRAQVIDFGYSAISKNSGQVNIPYSKNWTAPEWHLHRSFRYEEALKMDIYSFGLTCLWILSFVDHDYIPEPLLGQLPGSIDNILIEIAVDNPDIARFLGRAVQGDPMNRDICFTEIGRILKSTPNCSVQPQGEPTFHWPLQPVFSISASIYQLYSVDYRVRVRIFNLLAARIDMLDPASTGQKSVECQLALCFTFGFGTAADPTQAQLHLAASNETNDYIEAKIKEINEMDPVYGPLINDISSKASITPINFMYYYQKENILADAELAYRREIQDLESIFGLDHLLTIKLRSDLSKLVQHRGGWQEAEEIDLDILERNRKIHGLHHPSVVLSANNLAYNYNKQGKWAKAEQLLLEVINADSATHKQALAMATQSNLASIYRHQGKWDKAITLEKRVLKTNSDILGREHPQVLSIKSHLASSHRGNGDWEHAERLERQVTQKRKKVLGLEHPDTLLSMSNLSLTFTGQERWAMALEQEQKVQELYLKVLPEDHPTTLTSLGNIAYYHLNMMHYEKAKDLLLEVIEKKTKNMGLEHPSTLMSKSNLASIYYHQQHFEECATLHESILSAREKILGPDNPDTLMSLHTLGTVLWRKGLLKEGYEMLKKCYITQIKVLGKEHSHTRATLEDLKNTKEALPRDKQIPTDGT